MTDKRKTEKENIIVNEETRYVVSNPIAKGIESSIAMGIDTIYSPLPLFFNKELNNKSK